MPVKQLDFVVDKLTNSIQNAVTGDSFDTDVSALTKTESKLVKKLDWLFNWDQELNDIYKSVYKLTIVQNPQIIQGILSVENRGDHIFMHLIESARFNKGKRKIYLGVPGNLVAFACKLSYDSGYMGVVSFFA